MEGLLILIFFASSICFIIGLFRPSVFDTLFKKFGKSSTRKSNAILWFSIAIVSILFIPSSSNDTSIKKENQELKEQVKNLQQEVDSLKEPEPKIEENSKETTEESMNEEKQEGDPTQEVFKVVNVIDGDTIKLENGQVVRYIGIDTPETVHPSKPVQCFGKEASAKNEELVEGKEVRLVKDVSETDKYDRLLRYVYVGDTFVNDYLVREGFAHASSYPPDVRYQDQFKEAEQEARDNKRGLWADGACEVEPEPEPTPAPTPAASTTTTTKASGSYTCNCSKTCSQMSSCAEAQYQLNVCGCSKRDGDKDGVACDADCQ